MSQAGALARPLVEPVARAITKVRFYTGSSGEMLAGIGDIQLQGGQLYQSTLPNNAFPPESFGWELYGDEP